MMGRSDLEKYRSALKTCTNFYVLPTGGIDRRGGTIFTEEVKTSTRKTRIIPFEFSTTQAYVLEMGHLYFRIFYYVAGHPVQIKVTGTPVEVVTTYDESDLFELQFVQSADVLYIVHPDYPPRKITRTSHVAWAITTIDFTDGPYLDLNTNATKTLTLTGGAPWTSGSSLTMTAVGHTPFAATDVGKIYRLQTDAAGTAFAWVKITAYTSTSAVTVQAKINVVVGLQGVAVPHWRRGAWGGVEGNPRTVTFHEQRLVFAGSTFEPQTVWLSVSGSFEDFTEGIVDDDAFIFTIASNQVNTIQWLSSLDRLVIGTAASEFRVRSSGPALTPTDIDVKRQTSIGSTYRLPIQFDGSTIFVQRGGLKVYGYDYRYDLDRFDGIELTRLAEHILTSGVSDMAFSRIPNSLICFVRTDGSMAVITYYPSENIFAWSKFTTDGVIESVCTIPNATGNAIGIWIVVKRTINAVTKRYVEYFDDFYGRSLQMDSALVYSGAATSTLTGLAHLALKTVDILVKTVGTEDYTVHPQKTVTVGGVVTLDYDVTDAIVGLPYDSIAITVRPEGGSEIGSAMGLKKKYARIFVRINSSLGMYVNGQEINFVQGDIILGQPPPMFTGDKKISNIGWDSDGENTIEQRLPLPLTVLAIGAIEDTGDV